MTYKGVVKGNTVILEEGAHLPNGTTVIITTEQATLKEEGVTREELNERRALVMRMKEFGQKLMGRSMNLGDLILEAKDELENRA